MASTEITISLTADERTQLLSWLEERLRRTLVEEHRTESSEYRKHVLHDEEVLQSLIEKLKQG
jgi:hypothetical protein